MECCDDSDTPVAFHEGSDRSLCRISALPTDAATVQEPAYTVKIGALTLRAMQFSIFPSPPWAFDSFPPGGGRAALNEAALRRRSRGERLGWEEKYGRGMPPAFTPTLALPCQGGREKTDRRGS